MKEIEFSTSLLFFWIKGKVEVDNRFVKTNLSNTLLGFIPAGKDQQNVPLKNISGAMLSTKYYIKPIILGLFIFFIGLGSLGNSFIFGLLLLILGIGIAGNGLQTILKIEKSGTPYLIMVPFFEKQKMQLLNNTIHDALAEDTDKTDLNLYFDRKSQ
ncbi:hypothetical protein [Cytobacillus purgationiresistens]|uniref:Uncharacterized protein n=1 Tax=Cytobacillus purgationiresistens TaxID=863449 RepID=A0ABU0ANE8_9BACI|nr:hypothetical protein [Cytobacillus purgationiresistens]MDQ0271923.1 hypothetical protein [Cytobacillus purgationiresistens]